MIHEYDTLKNSFFFQIKNRGFIEYWQKQSSEFKIQKKFSKNIWQLITRYLVFENQSHILFFEKSRHTVHYSISQTYIPLLKNWLTHIPWYFVDLVQANIISFLQKNLEPQCISLISQSNILLLKNWLTHPLIFWFRIE